jgi:hypothetical protein
MFVKFINGQAAKFPYTMGDLRTDHPQTSFPDQMTNETLASFDVYPVKQTSEPVLDSKTHSHSVTVEAVDGEWTQVWQVVELPRDQAESNVRGHRNRLLKESDWTQVADAPVDQAAWAAYRQALRDVTAQEGFPHNVTWPTQP